MLAVLSATTIDQSLFFPMCVLALLIGVAAVLPIGGADMPVVISLLNSFTGLAAAATGFVLGNDALIIAGTLVGASGTLLTQLMSKAMNRSIANVLFGAFGGGPAVVVRRRGGSATGRCATPRPPTSACCSATRGASSSCPATASRWRRRSTASASWPTCSRSAASTSSTPSTPSPAACRAT